MFREISLISNLLSNSDDFGLGNGTSSGEGMIGERQKLGQLMR